MNMNGDPARATTSAGVRKRWKAARGRAAWTWLELTVILMRIWWGCSSGSPTDFKVTSKVGWGSWLHEDRQGGLCWCDLDIDVRERGRSDDKKASARWSFTSNRATIMIMILILNEKGENMNMFHFFVLCSKMCLLCMDFLTMCSKCYEMRLVFPTY